MTEIYQPSLFPSKGDFDSEEFKAIVLADPRFLQCIRNGILSGLEKTKSKFQDGENSKSVISHCLHEDIFNGIKNEFLHLGMQVSSRPIVAGNELAYFEFKGYTFIIKLANQTSNSTNQQNDIRNQNWSNHVITIVYTLDEIRESINTATLKYIEGKSVIWEYVIPMEDSQTITEAEHDNTMLTPQKPKLKKARTDKDAI